MITEFFIGLWDTIAVWFLGFFSSDNLPAWFLQFGDLISNLLASSAGMGAWLDWAFAIAVVVTVLTLWVVGFAVKTVRWLLGLIPTMGGG